MKRLFVIAALLMATTAAHASNSVNFEIGGHKIHVEAPKDCNKLSCLKVSSPNGTGFDLKGLKSKHSGDDDAVADRANPAPQNAAPAPAAVAPQPAAPATTVTAPAPATVASTDSKPGVGFETRAPVAAAPAAPAPAAVAPAAPVAAAPAAPVAAAPAAASNSPIGIWATEENKGSVRVEACGANLCGFTDHTNEKILINMRPQDSKWVGLIHDPKSGRNYDSTIAIKDPNTLRVQGCAFGGLFCGGQTWKRVS
jgi:uncharacterized protein (DUF2147 family)